MHSPLQFGFAAILLLAPAACLAADDGPVMRHTNYLAFLGSGQTRSIEIRSKKIASYSHELQYRLIGRDSRDIAAGDLRLGASVRLEARGDADRLAVLELEAGENSCRVSPGEGCFAYVASELNPLHTAGGLGPVYFYVPDRCKQFSIYVTAGAVREGARVRIAGPDGQTVHEEEGDYDKRQAIKVRVPQGADGKAWSLAILRPNSRALVLDDVILSLDSALPPYLAKQADWAVQLGTRK